MILETDWMILRLLLARHGSEKAINKSFKNIINSIKWDLVVKGFSPSPKCLNMCLPRYRNVPSVSDEMEFDSSSNQDQREQK